jgi:polyisoprenoid-binding protein YceI
MKGKIIIVVLAIVLIIIWLTSGSSDDMDTTTDNVEESEMSEETNSDESMAEEGDTKMEGEETAMMTDSNVNLQASAISWTGSKIVGVSHVGLTSFKSASLTFDETGLITGGEFLIDMSSTVSLAEEGAFMEHVMSADFFDVEQYPEGKFIVTGSDETVIFGDLTLKDITKAIEVPYILENGVYTADIDINRTDWGINYGSGLTGAVGDSLIDDTVLIQLLIATKEA